MNAMTGSCGSFINDVTRDPEVCFECKKHRDAGVKHTESVQKNVVTRPNPKKVERECAINFDRKFLGTLRKHPI